MNRLLVLGAGAVLALVVLLGAVLVWSGWRGDQGPVPGEAAPSPDRPAAPAAPLVALLPDTGASAAASPAALMADYRDSGGRAHARHAGKRLLLQGAVVSVESGENGLSMVSLDAGPDLPPARAVIASSDAARVRDWQAGRAVVLDCANQGLLMGEPLLADCRAVKD